MIRRPDAWLLRESDLPPHWILARESRFGELEENAAFRWLAGRRRRESRGIFLRLALMVPMVFLFGYLILVVRPDPLLVFASYAIFMVTMRRFQKAVNPMDGLLKLPRDVALDLHLAGATKDQILSGLWAGGLSQAELVRASVLCMAFILGSLGVCFLPVVNTNPMFLFVGFTCLAMGAQFFGATAMEPYMELAGLRFHLRGQLIKQEAALRGRPVVSQLRHSIRYFARVTGPIIAGYAPIFALERGWMQSWFYGQSDVVTISLMGAIAGLVALAIGLVRGSMARASVGQNADEARDCIARIMQVLLETREQPKGDRNKD